MAEENKARRRLIINRRFQMKFAFILVLLHVNVGFLYQIILHYRVQNLAAEAGSLKAFLALNPWQPIWPAMLIAGVISSLAVYFIGIRYSHQIVGPLPRIQRALRQIAAGRKPERLEFRPGDVLEELASEVNRLANVTRVDHPDRVGYEEYDEEGDHSEAGEEPKVDPASILGRPSDREPINS